MSAYEFGTSISMFFAIFIMVGSLAFLAYCLYVAGRLGIEKARDRIAIWRRAIRRWWSLRTDKKRREAAARWRIAFPEPEQKPVRNGANVFYIPPRMRDAK